MAQTDYTPISIYYSSTATNVPTAGNLVAGELAINTADGKLFYKDSAGVVQVIGTKGGVNGTTSGQVLFNNAGVVGGSSNHFWDNTNNRLGVGTASPTTTLDVAGNAVLSGTSGYKYLYFNSVTESSSLRFAKIGKNYDSTFDLGFWASTHTAGNSAATVFYRDLTTESMRIDSSGNLLVGKTTTGVLNTGTQFYPAGTNSAITSSDTSTTGPLFYLVNAGATVQNGYRFTSFRNTSGFTEIGTITNNNGTGVLYNITSDYRLKNVIAPVTNSGERLDLLEPIEYDWKSNGIRTKGFLAHKFAEVYPNSVSGEKDAIDKEGKPAYQGMQPSSAEVMADLISEIQSLRKRLTVLEAK